MNFENVPDQSRVWIYGFSKRLNPAEIELVTNRLQIFADSWQVHGSQVQGGFELLENQFVLLATNDTVSGCSIDSSVSVFREIKEIHGLDALNQELIFYKNEGDEILPVSRSEFQQHVQSGKIQSDTRVFNLMLNTYGQFREGLFETTFSNCWHSKVFKIPQVTI